MRGIRCNICDRVEMFEPGDIEIGYAWYYNHMMAEHEDAMPPVKNDE